MATSTAPDREQVRSTINDTNRRFMEAISRGDADGAADVYTEFARVMPPDMPMMEGKAAIRGLWAGAMDQMGLKQARLDTVELEILGDWAYEIGRYGLTIQPPGGQPTEARGKYVVVWKHVAGAWKWHVDIWNSDVPAQ
jgi:ketosteroid isomerase-like protein